MAERLTEYGGGANIWLKREDLNHTGSHKINNALGQILLARKLGKTEIIAETGAGQHGVATATVCAKFGMKCTIYMGAVSFTHFFLVLFLFYFSFAHSSPCIPLAGVSMVEGGRVLGQSKG